MKTMLVVLVLMMAFGSVALADMNAGIVFSTFSDLDEITLNASKQVGGYEGFEFYVDALYATKVKRLGVGVSASIPESTPIVGDFLDFVNADRGGVSLFFPKIDNMDFSEVDWAIYIIPKFATFEF
jgi:hypothetical protein